ncbi:MAG TPA: cytochrome c biogenesis protein CcdA [Anaerolineales bacterium]|nr:cytochrome c biogenesis protein CcdA [Anaerolineales bacterium]
MTASQLSIPIAFLAGLLSFLSPCVFALVPAYLGVLSGRAVQAAGVATAEHPLQRWLTLLHALAFVLGFAVVFIIGGFALSALGGLLFDLTPWLMRLGGIVVILFGLHTLGIVYIPFLDYDRRLNLDSVQTSSNLLSSFAMGISFSAGWSPCVGPIFGAILTAAANNSSLALPLLLAYTSGLAVPFLLSALLIDQIRPLVRKSGKIMPIVKYVTGGLLLLIGVLLLLGRLTVLNASLGSQPWALAFQQWMDNLLMGMAK